MDHASRLHHLSQDLTEPLLVTNLTNIRYLTGFTGSNASLLVNPSRAVFLTDGRYGETAAELVRALPATELVVYSSGLHDRLDAAFDGAPRVQLESAHVSWRFVRELGATTGSKLVASDGLVERYRRVKDAAEIEALRSAAAAGDAAFAALEELAPQAATEHAVAEALVGAMERAGGDRAGWPPIVAADSNASRPHHEAGTDPVGAGLLLLDYGCTVDGYHSDMTRTVWRGAEPDPELERVFQAVREANDAGIAAVGPGMVAGEVDAVCRRVLEGYGYDEYFVHSTGHGVGLDIHEGPWLRRNSEDVLEPGHVVTVEPGVYLPGRLGVRIEDMVLVTADGRHVLTNASKELRSA